MKLVTWNINSIRARDERLVAWLDARAARRAVPAGDQGRGRGFPARARSAAPATRSRLSVSAATTASRSRRTTPLADVTRGFGDGEPDDEARADRRDDRTACASSASTSRTARISTSDKYPYKLAWYRRLRALPRSHRDADDRARRVRRHQRHARRSRRVVAREVGRPDPLQPAGARGARRGRRRSGSSIVFREHHPDGGVYSWWDYRGVSVLQEPGPAHRLHLRDASRSPRRAPRCTIDRNARKGQDASRSRAGDRRDRLISARVSASRGARRRSRTPTLDAT